MTPPQDPNSMVVNIQLSWAKLLTSLGTVVVTVIGGYIGLIYLIYGGIDTRLKTLEDHFQTAISASADVKHLLDTAPTLEQQITDTRIDVKGIKDSMDLLNPRETHDTIVALKPVPQQLQEIKTHAISDTSPRHA